MPIGFHYAGFFYNPKVMSDAGITEMPQSWDDLVAACQTVKAKGIDAFAPGSKNRWPAPYEVFFAHAADTLNSRPTQSAAQVRHAGRRTGRPAGHGHHRRRAARATHRHRRQCIEIANEVESPPTINLFSGPASWNPAALVVGRDTTYSAAWDRILRSTEVFVKRAEELGVDLAVEGVWGMVCHGFFTTSHLIETFDSPRLGVNYDPSHDGLVGLEDVDWVIRQWQAKSRIKHVPLKDAAGTAEGGRFLFPMLGEGRIDWTAFFAALEDTG